MNLFNRLKNTLRRFGFLDDLSIGKNPPCQSCGACCSFFKISFYDKINQQVPAELKVRKNIETSAMKGADKFKGKCIAFSGKIGEDCACTIYPNRPNVCREFPVYLRDGSQNPKCYRARKYYGLTPEIT